MKKTCVFKCQFDKTWYRVYEFVHPDKEQCKLYQTYVGRKKLDTFPWSSLGSAIGSILSSVDCDILNCLTRIWS